MEQEQQLQQQVVTTEGSCEQRSSPEQGIDCDSSSQGQEGALEQQLTNIQEQAATGKQQGVIGEELSDLKIQSCNHSNNHTFDDNGVDMDDKTSDVPKEGAIEVEEEEEGNSSLVALMNAVKVAAQSSIVVPAPVENAVVDESQPPNPDIDEIHHEEQPLLSPKSGDTQVSNGYRYTREELIHIATTTNTSHLPADLDANRLRDLQDTLVFRSSSNLNTPSSANTTNSFNGVQSISSGMTLPSFGGTQPSSSPKRTNSSLQPTAAPFRSSSKLRNQASGGVRSNLLEDNPEGGQGEPRRGNTVDADNAFLAEGGIPIKNQGGKQRGWNVGDEGWRGDQFRSSPKSSAEPNGGSGWERSRGSWERGRGPRPKSVGRGRGRLDDDELFGGMQPTELAAPDFSLASAPSGGLPGLVKGAGAEVENMQQGALKIEQERLMMQEHFKKQQLQNQMGLQPKEGELTDTDFEEMKREQEEQDRRDQMGFPSLQPQGQGQKQVDVKALLGQLSSMQSAGRGGPNPGMMGMFNNMGQVQKNRQASLLAGLQQQQQQQQFLQQQQHQQGRQGGGGQSISLDDLFNSVKQNTMGGRSDQGANWKPPEDVDRAIPGGEGGGISNPPRPGSQASQHLFNLLAASQDQQQQQQRQQQLLQQLNRPQNPAAAPGVGGNPDLAKLMQILADKQRATQQQNQVQALLGQQGGLNPQDQGVKPAVGQDSLGVLQQAVQQRAAGASALDALLQSGIANRPQTNLGNFGFQQRTPAQQLQNPGFQSQPGGQSQMELLVKVLQQQQQKQQQQQQQQSAHNLLGGGLGGGLQNPHPQLGQSGNNLQALMMQLKQQQQQQQQEQQLQQQQQMQLNALRQQQQQQQQNSGGLFAGRGGFQVGNFGGNPNTQFGMGMGGGVNPQVTPRPPLNGGLQNLLNQTNPGGQLQGQQPQLTSLQDNELLQRLLSLSRQSQQQQQLQQQQQQLGNQMQTPSLTSAPISPLLGSQGVGIPGGLGVLQNKGGQDLNPSMSLQPSGDATEDGGQHQDN